MTKKNLKKIKNSASGKYEWFFYANSYLGLARIGCLELIKQGYREKNSLINDLLYGSEYSQLKLLLIAIFFNIKHALELFIKGAGVNLDKKYWEEHDIDFLLADLEKRIKSLNIFKNKDEISSKVLALKPVISDYLSCYLLDGVRKMKYRDFHNLVFKYPESRNPTLNKYLNFFEKDNIFDDLRKFNKLGIKIVLKDIDKIHEIFSILDYRITSAKISGLDKIL